MSVGHHHGAPNLLKPSKHSLAMLHRFLASPSAVRLMKRFDRFDMDHDIVYTCGYDVLGTARYADKDYVRALYDPEYAKQILGAPIDTGLSPDDTLECTLHHEAVEKVIMDDPTNPIDLYDHHDEPGGFGAHEYATFAEHLMVRSKHGDPARYEKGLEGIIKFCEHKKLVKVPKDYACAPLLDDPDENEKRVIKVLQGLGVTDAFKKSKEIYHYDPGTSPARRCGMCAHRQNDGIDGLFTCELVDGLVAPYRVCDKFEAAENGDGKEIQSGRPQGEAPPRVGNPGGREDTSVAAGKRDALVQ